jgi:hypothetical protein
MKQYIHHRTKIILLVLAGGIALCAACKKSNYYIDGGITDAKYNGTILEYLKSKPRTFDTLTQVIKLAGLEDTLQNKQMTLFAPVNNSFKLLLVTLNLNLYATGKDTIKTLADVNGTIWRKYLLQYMYRNANKLVDYPQLDLNAKSLYPGQNYISMGDVVYNIGVIYDDAGDKDRGIVKYGGYRHLCISFIPNTAQPFDNWNSALISTSDVQPTNGVVHVLRSNHAFSFDGTNFIQDVRLTR